MAIQEIMYQPSNEDFCNPERGFYHWISTVSGANYGDIRLAGGSLARPTFQLDAFRQQDLPGSFLSGVGRVFDDVRAAGLKAVPLFAYNDGYQPDASREWILRHIEQLGPVLQANADVIALMEAGFIGAWGEWHNSTNGLDNDVDRRDILFALLDVLPQSIMVTVRTPGYKRGIFSGAIISEETAFDSSHLSRVGHHNLAFLASDNDWGTYDRDNIEDDKDYIAWESRFTPVGGETATAEIGSRVSCENALAELARMGWAFLSPTYHRDAIDVFKAEGCWDEISRRLGYRFVLERLVVDITANVLSIHLELENVGFAAPFNERPVFLVLEGDDTISLPLDAGPRRWLPGSVIVDEAWELPDMPAGDYDLFLWLPDVAERLRDRPEYSVRFANADVWRPDTGRNHLTEITITEDSVAIVDDLRRIESEMRAEAQTLLSKIDEISAIISRLSVFDDQLDADADVIEAD